MLDEIPGASLEKTVTIETDSLAPIFEQVFNLEIQESQPAVEQWIQKFDAAKYGAQAARVKMGLEALWHYFEAFRLVQAEANFHEAVKLYSLAENAFTQLGCQELAALSVGMRAYSQAVLEIQSFNIGQALELFAKVKQYLQTAGKFGSRFQIVIAHMEPEALATAGVNAMMRLDYSTATALLEKASQASESLAKKYYSPGELHYSSFLGMAHYYRAFNMFFLTYNDINLFNYDKILREKNLAQEAVLACDLLKKGDTESVGFKNAVFLAEAFRELLETLERFAAVMQGVLQSTFKSDMSELSELRKKLRRAGEYLTQAGPQNVAFVRLCEQLSRQMDNLERLAKPRRKDFGIYSGVIALALFVPLFFAVSWSNESFKMGLEGGVVLSTCLSLALIGGFGFGALKFKSLIFSKTAKAESE